jgi:hypothetical protein
MFFRLALNILLIDRSVENPYWLIALLAAANCIAVYHQSLITVVLLSALLIIFAVAAFVIMLLAPLAWGESNTSYTHHVQLSAIIIATVQLASIFVVVASRKRHS